MSAVTRWLNRWKASWLMLTNGFRHDRPCPWCEKSYATREHVTDELKQRGLW